MAPPRARIFLIVLLTLASTSDAAVVKPARSTVLASRADVNLTLLSNATSIVQNLDYTSNCSLSISWYENLPSSGAGSGSDTVNIDFLRSALPNEYQDESDAQITSFYDDMSTGGLSSLGWIGTAKDDVETACIAPQFEKQISLSNLDATQNCTATAIFLSSLGWITGVQNYTASSSNDTSWLEFLRASLPLSDRNNFTDLELLVYRNFFLDSENAASITTFLKIGFDHCQKIICEVQGYTGNPDIGGIGVISSYTVEAALVTLYFVAINFQVWMEGAGYANKIPSRITRALDKASDELADGALFFSLSISSAGWVSFVSDTSYYEKLVFTSANVLALSALFAFLGMFTESGRKNSLGKKRGEWILAVVIAAILTESAIQYIVYLKEPNDIYDDYACLHLQFQDQGYHPIVFEALFFILLGLSVIAGIVGIFWLRHRSKAEERATSTHSKTATVHPMGMGKDVRVQTIDTWVTVTRIFIQTVAIAVMWVELVYLWKIRTIMSKIAGSTWSEGNWGFGQILALFIWLPPIIDILAHLVLPEWMTGGEKRKKKQKCKCGSKKSGNPCTCPPRGGPVDEKDEKGVGAEAPLTPPSVVGSDQKSATKENIAAAPHSPLPVNAVPNKITKESVTHVSPE
ncbi:hypothetical protein BDZ45DRAFT_755350 [Acephala macrosclerotiorum]|nr:hypothetical protein BDZ45DRAFT_755350 [Acephala macrosclerotiorum]